jgi:hypothetical protein
VAERGPNKAMNGIESVVAEQGSDFNGAAILEMQWLEVTQLSFRRIGDLAVEGPNSFGI